MSIISCSRKAQELMPFITLPWPVHGLKPDGTPSFLPGCSTLSFPFLSIHLLRRCGILWRVGLQHKVRRTSLVHLEGDTCSTPLLVLAQEDQLGVAFLIFNQVHPTPDIYICVYKYIYICLFFWHGKKEPSFFNSLTILVINSLIITMQCRKKIRETTRATWSLSPPNPSVSFRGFGPSTGFRSYRVGKTIICNVTFRPEASRVDPTGFYQNCLC